MQSTRNLSLRWALLSACLLLPASARASDPILCPVGNCCTFCYNPSCSANPDHPENECRLGTRLELVSACDLQQCLDEAAADYPDLPLTITSPPSGGIMASECIPRRAPIAEVNDGYDNDCDGNYLGDECNGLDDDGDGSADNDVGSCAERHLFVPYCWRTQGMSQAAQYEELQAAVDRWENWFQKRSALSQCGKRQVWYEAASMDAVQVTAPDQRKNGLVDCPIPQPYTSGAWTGTESLLTALMRWLEQTGKYNLDDWDIITFVTNPPNADTVKGYVPYLGATLIHMTTGGKEPLYPGEYFAWAHEYGHTLRLLEEYDNFPDGPNPLKPEYGCDVGILPDGTEGSWDNIGPCCGPYPTSGCRIDVSVDDPTHCKNVDPRGKGYVCDGNLALNLENWQWGDPPPSVYGTGRSIMSWTEATGWDAGDLDTGEGSTRGWSQPAWDYWGQVGMRCDTEYAGNLRRVDTRAQLTSDGQLFLIGQEIGVGRVGPLGSAGNEGSTYSVELYDQSGVLLGRQGVNPAPNASTLDVGLLPPEALGDFAPVWIRIPVAANVGSKIKYLVVDDAGTSVSQVTGGGSAPIAHAANLTVECTEASGTLVQLDASGSSDPDGDTISYTWSIAAPVTLTNANAAQPTGMFPLGVTSVSLEARDGAGLSSQAAAAVTVRDTTAPTISPWTPTVTTCTPEPQAVTVPAPAVFDACSSIASLSGAVIRVNGKSVTPIPIINDQVVLPVGAHEVRWTVVDAAGNSRFSDFPLTVQHIVTQACCSSNQTYLAGTNNPDIFVGLPPGAYCVNSQSGFFDFSLTLFTENDFLAGGSGYDTLIGGGGNDVIQTGPGGSFIQGGAFGTLKAYGGSGNDIVDAGLSGASLIYGGAGNDRLGGSLGDDYVVPGGGLDSVSTGFGNDTIVIHNVCELVAGENIDGGFGNDTLISPVSQLQLFLRGILVLNIENFIIDTTKAHLSDCF